MPKITLELNISPINKKGFNLYQVRTYATSGVLMESQIFYRRSQARAHFCRAVWDKQGGAGISHAVLRCANTVLGDWIMCEIIPNPLQQKEENKRPTRWKLALYSVSDAMLHAEERDQAYSEDAIASIMEQHQACFAVVSSNDGSQERDGFTFDRLVVNEKFDFSPFDESGGKKLPYGVEKVQKTRLLQLLLLREKNNKL